MATNLNISGTLTVGGVKLNGIKLAGESPERVLLIDSNKNVITSTIALNELETLENAVAIGNGSLFDTWTYFLNNVFGKMTTDINVTSKYGFTPFELTAETELKDFTTDLPAGTIYYCHVGANQTTLYNQIGEQIIESVGELLVLRSSLGNHTMFIYIRRAPNWITEVYFTCHTTVENRGFDRNWKKFTTTDV